MFMKNTILTALAVLFFAIPSFSQALPEIFINSTGTGCNDDLYVVVEAYDIGTCTFVGRSFPILVPFGTINQRYDHTTTPWDINPGVPSITNDWVFLKAYAYSCNVPSYLSAPGTGGTSPCPAPGAGLTDIVSVGLPSCTGLTNQACFEFTAGCGGSSPCVSPAFIQVVFSPGHTTVLDFNYN